MAADLCRQHKLVTADAIIYATALLLDVELLTCDAHFKDLPNVIFVPKGTTNNEARKPGAYELIIFICLSNGAGERI